MPRNILTLALRMGQSQAIAGVTPRRRMEDGVDEVQMVMGVFSFSTNPLPLCVFYSIKLVPLFRVSIE